MATAQKKTDIHLQPPTFNFLKCIFSVQTTALITTLHLQAFKGVSFKVVEVVVSIRMIIKQNLNVYIPYIQLCMLCVVSWPGRRRTEVPPRMLHLSELQGLHRRRGHVRSGGAVQALLVSPHRPACEVTTCVDCRLRLEVSVGLYKSVYFYVVCRSQGLFPVAKLLQVITVQDQ